MKNKKLLFICIGVILISLFLVYHVRILRLINVSSEKTITITDYGIGFDYKGECMAEVSCPYYVTATAMNPCNGTLGLIYIDGPSNFILFYDWLGLERHIVEKGEKFFTVKPHLSVGENLRFSTDTYINWTLNPEDFVCDLIFPETGFYTIQYFAGHLENNTLLIDDTRTLNVQATPLIGAKLKLTEETFPEFGDNILLLRKASPDPRYAQYDVHYIGPQNPISVTIVCEAEIVSTYPAPWGASMYHYITYVDGPADAIWLEGPLDKGQSRYIGPLDFPDILKLYSFTNYDLIPVNITVGAGHLAFPREGTYKLLIQVGYIEIGYNIFHETDRAEVTIDVTQESQPPSTPSILDLLCKNWWILSLAVLPILVVASIKLLKNYL